MTLDAAQKKCNPDLGLTGKNHQYSSLAIAEVLCLADLHREESLAREDTSPIALRQETRYLQGLLHLKNSKYVQHSAIENHPLHHERGSHLKKSASSVGVISALRKLEDEDAIHDP